MFKSIITHFASYIVLICNIHCWAPFLFTASGPRQCMAHGWDHNVSLWNLWPFENSLLLNLSYSIACFCFAWERISFIKIIYLLCILHSLISNLKMNTIIWVFFYVSGEFKYKNMVLVVTSSIWALGDFLLGWWMWLNHLCLLTCTLSSLGVGFQRWQR